MLWCCVCLSVCLSVAQVYCVETTELTIRQLAQYFSLGALVYGHQTWNIYLYGTPHRGRYIAEGY